MHKVLSWKALFLFIIFCLFLLPLFNEGIYLTHDAEANIARFAAYFKAFSDGQIPPRWAGDLNFRYGSPVLIFYYPLTGYISSLMHFFGIGFETIYKILISVGFLGSFFTFYAWSRSKFSKNISFFAALIYFASPYHLLNLYVRGDVAELTALAIAPLVFLFIDRIYKTRKIKDILIGSFIYAFLIMAHNGVALIFSPAILIYCLLGYRKKNIPISLFMILGGLGLSSFFWIPAIVEGKYVNAKLFVGDIYKDSFLNIFQIVYSSWGFGADVKKTGGLSPQIGAPYLLLVLSSLGLLWRSKNKIFYFWVFIFITSTFMTFSLSDFIWSRLPLLKLLEFPWRFMSLVSFSAAVLIAHFFGKIGKEKIIFMLSSVVLLYCALFIKVDRQISPMLDSFYINYPYTTYFHGEASSVWTAGDAFSYPNAKFKIIGDAQIKNYKRNSNLHSFQSISDNDFKFIDYTNYFPGWTAKIDGVKTKIEFQDMNNRGLITFDIPKGRHNIKIEFAESAVRLYADLVSLFSLVFIGLIFILKRNNE